MWDSLDDPFCGTSCALDAAASASNVLDVPITHPMFMRVAQYFIQSWGIDSKAPVVTRVFRVISSSEAQANHESYRESMDSSCELWQVPGNQDRRWYGPRCPCLIGQSSQSVTCTFPTCGICRTIKSLEYLRGKALKWRRYDWGFSMSSSPSRSFDRLFQQSSSRPLKPVLLCEVIAGNVYSVERDERLTEIPEGYNSVGELTFPDIPKPRPLATVRSQGERLPLFDHTITPHIPGGPMKADRGSSKAERRSVKADDGFDKAVGGSVEATGGSFKAIGGSFKAIGGSTDATSAMPVVDGPRQELPEPVRTYSANGGRPPKGPCSYYGTTKGCKYGKDCKFSHVQGLPGPVRTHSANGSRPPKGPCSFYNTMKGCQNGEYCAFSHDKTASSSSQWRRSNSDDNIQTGGSNPRNGSRPSEPRAHGRPANEYDSLVVFDHRAILPLYLVMYE
ncbi:hypothetical protein JAAARDRAFT_589928 [Jaapia argillacea MUCL 33604]|uniref:C3H1-type domain-containing protein n=1 Tax=Jaapia argillacea MUCL 33604 TaxID=933084 RepID=A0A067P5Z2_9AGAM|nr:hypothetical protein JAAARDRAFT_589928 [Jaapia argillacea MUCL 33604]